LKTNKVKLAIIIGFLAVTVLFFTSGIKDYLSFDLLKDKQVELIQYAEQNSALSIFLFFALYVLVTGASLPGATILTLAGGAIFGFLKGLLIVSFASTTGATLAFLSSRYLLRNYIKEKFSSKMALIDEGVKNEGAFYLFALRLVPLFPFFMINLVMGLTALPVGRFFLVSQLGMLPGTAVYVNAGAQIANIGSLKDIASPGLLISFAALGLLPLAARKIVAILRSR
jgi:uncharacterized membrane protein YdjX (TVP38/TMEM64 family)